MMSYESDTDRALTAVLQREELFFIRQPVLQAGQRIMVAFLCKFFRQQALFAAHLPRYRSPALKTPGASMCDAGLSTPRNPCSLPPTNMGTVIRLLIPCGCRQSYSMRRAGSSLRASTSSIMLIFFCWCWKTHPPTPQRHQWERFEGFRSAA